MTNKKLWLSLLAIVLIVCMLSVGLMACNKEDPEPEPEPEEEETVESKAIAAIVSGIQKSVAAGDMTDLKVDGTATLELNDTKYSLDLALDLDLLQYNGWTDYTANTAAFNKDETYYIKQRKADATDGDESEEAYEYVKADIKAFTPGVTYYTRSKKELETATKSNTFLNAEIKKGNDVLLGAYYWDAEQELAANADVYKGDALYVQFYDSSVNQQKKMVFPAPYVNALMKAMGASVDFHNIHLDDEDVWGSLDSVLTIIGGLAQDGVYEPGKKASITINLAAVLNQFSTVLNSAQSYFDDLGLNIKGSELGELLPAISITLAADLDSTGMAKGFDISLNIAKKDTLEIKKVKNGQVGEAFLKINMDDAVNVKVGLDYTIGGTPRTFAEVSNLNTYEVRKNLVDIDLSVDLFVGQQIEMKLGDTNMKITVPSGYYTANLSAAIEPFSIVSQIKNMSFDSVSDIITTIKTIVDSVSGLELSLTRTLEADGTTAVPAADQKVLVVVISEQYSAGQVVIDEDTHKPARIATISTSILSGASINVPGLSLDSAISTVQGVLNQLIKPSDESVSGDEAEDNISKILKTVGSYLAGAYIGINDKVATHGKVYASFDSTKTSYGVIPFSGYTEYKGTIDAASTIKFYKRTGGDNYVVNTAAYSATETYYVKVGGTYREVNKTEEAYNQYRKYYFLNEDEYEYQEGLSEAQYNAAAHVYVFTKEDFIKANISAFEQGTTYYVYKAATYTDAIDAATAKAEYDAAAADKKPTFYVKGLSDGGDYGIGLKASLNIDKKNNKLALEINAEVTNLGFLGLPNIIKASISNIDIKLWQNNYPIHIESTPGRLNDLTASV